MSEDRMRAMFRQADASLGHHPPSLDATVRQAKREQSVRRAAYASAAALVVVVLGVAAYNGLRPERSELTPIATPVLPTPRPTPLPTCGDLGVIGDNPSGFVDDFMQRRIAGAGAESCLTRGAAEQYRTQNADPYDPNANGGGGPLCLYACGEFDVVDYRLETAHDADANSYEAAVVVMLSDGNETVRQYEAFTFGTGVPSTSDEPQVFVVRGAWTTPGLP